MVLPEDHFGTWNRLCSQFDITLPHRLVAGGETRFHSVKNALETIGDEGLVAIHDAARPLITPELIRKAFQEAEIHGNSIPVVPFSESVRMMEEDTSVPLDRSRLRVVQTPQVFSASLIRRAYRQEYRQEFTDDATVAESTGITIRLIDGDPRNFKITTQTDLAVAEMMLHLD